MANLRRKKNFLNLMSCRLHYKRNGRTCEGTQKPPTLAEKNTCNIWVRTRDSIASLRCRGLVCGIFLVVLLFFIIMDWSDAQVDMLKSNQIALIILLVLSCNRLHMEGAVHEISLLLASASSKGSGESAHMRRLARAFAARIHNSMDSYEISD